jgi:Na+/H+ antiporter NhaD/arsenite permease-like protein
MQASRETDRKRFTAATLILVLIVAYGVAAIFGLPQYGSQLILQSAHHETAGESTGDHGSVNGHAGDSDGDHGSATAVVPPAFYAVVPFVLLLGAIAILPLIPATEQWWESNTNRFLLAVVLAGGTLCYYLFLHATPMDGHWPAHYLAHPGETAIQFSFAKAILGNAILGEYIPFIVLLFSLYTISGGIRIEGDLRANPMTNAAFIGIGGLSASLIGTTGAAMLLIRPLLETNKERKHVVHTVVFFIFVVCNCGGCLLPIGDPPLFLGYLEGVDFWWTLTLWKPWLFVNGLLLLVYLLVDGYWFYPKETIGDIKRDMTHTRRLRVQGLGLNAPLLLGVVCAVALLDPSRTLSGTSWRPWMFLREIAQLGLVTISLIYGNQLIRKANSFSYHAIVEVAALFLGIFICMQPALQLLSFYGADLGINTPARFFWITGGLSSVLDNAPTYLVFFKMAQSMDPGDAITVAGVAEPTLIGISLGAVFMGAMTYIGNGPNFMVKALAERSGVPMPSFFGYILYSGTVLIPILALAAWQFLL